MLYYIILILQFASPIEESIVTLVFLVWVKGLLQKVYIKSPNLQMTVVGKENHMKSQRKISKRISKYKSKMGYASLGI